MSHKATNWLSGIPANLIGASEFRILFHLCDCHNPSKGCFPTQAYLRGCTGSSNGTVNNALNALEAKGLIARHREREKGSKRQKPTRYILGFEMEKSQKPSPNTGDGADSNLGGDPSPIWRQSRLQPTGEKPVSKPVNNHARTREAQFFTNSEQFEAKQVCEFVKGGGRPNAQAIPSRVLECLIAKAMLSVDEMTRAGLGKK
ncbi:helix-turn-helix domain-containing protein [Falsihalocynthiibacter sp. S25ZX9]|uniref:helix-turn-helix domain-containing protein n=1 Tax=Falsihalocynthiibacter sp. S25ZX9 TaxID=3240870 RepID=UPI00350F9E27